MENEVLLMNLENLPERVFSIDEIEKICALVSTGKIVIFEVVDRSEDESVKVINLFGDDKTKVETVKNVFSRARVGLMEESTGMANYKYQIWTREEKAVKLLADAGLTVKKLIEEKSETKKEAKELEKAVR